MRPPSIAIRIPLYVILIFFAAIALIPFLWLLAATTKGKDDLFSYTFFAPRVTFESFTDLFTKVPFWRYILNSVFITCAGVTIQLFLSSLAGFALAKYDFKGKPVLYLLMLATMMIPGQVTIAPTYELLYKMH